MYFVWKLLGVFVLCLTAIPATTPSSTENQLVKRLLNEYSKFSRPIREEGDNFTVHFGIALLQLIDINDKTQIVTSNILFRLQWKDAYLQWNSSEVKGISTVHIPVNMIWHPDISLLNSAEDKSGIFSSDKANFVIRNDGVVRFVQRIILKSSCRIDVTWFPFDTQTCKLDFGSWIYSVNAMDVQLRENATQLGNYIENGKWTLVRMEAERKETIYSCCPYEPYVNLIFTIVVKRKSLYYFFNLWAHRVSGRLGLHPSSGFG